MEDASSRIYTLPLFPLHCVLYPGIPLQLHVFEERYREMVKRCVSRSEPFGVVLIREGDETGEPAVPWEVGCTARILAMHNLEDGKIHLLTLGEERFRILEYAPAEVPYLIARVEAYSDASNPPEEEENISEEFEAVISSIQTLFIRYMKLLAESAQVELPEVELPADSIALSYCVAWIIQVELETKQALLEMKDNHERLKSELTLLRIQTEELEKQIAITNEDTGQDADPRPTMLATPLDAESDTFQTYLREGRN